MLVYFVNHNSWPFLGFIAVILSHVLIFTVGNDVEFGAIAKLCILVAALRALGSVLFTNMITAEQENLLEQVSQPADRILNEKDFQHLPATEERWLFASDVPNKPAINFVWLKQSA
jgi:hypothetical protein